MKYIKILFFICVLYNNCSAQVERFVSPMNLIQNWKIFNNDSSQSVGIGCALQNSIAPQFPATFFHDSTGCMLFDSYCYNPLKGFSDDYAIRKAPYKINNKDSIVLWYGANVHWRNWTTGQNYVKFDTIEIVYAILDSSLILTDSTYPNPSHMHNLGFLITTQDSIVMKRYAQSLNSLISQGNNETTVYLGFRKHMFTQDCSAWIDNVYMSNSGLNATEPLNSFSWEIYPNPGKDGFYLRSHENIASITLRDMNGKIVLKAANLNNYIETPNLAIGIYTVELKTLDGKISVGKWAIK